MTKQQKQLSLGSPTKALSELSEMSPELRLIPAQPLDRRRGQPAPGGPAERRAQREVRGVSVSKTKGAVAVQKGVQEWARKVGTQDDPDVQEAQRGPREGRPASGPPHGGSAPH